MKAICTVAVVLLCVLGCFSTTMRLRGSDGNLVYEAGGLNRPEPMEAASADLTSAQADYIRAQARTLERHPEMFFGWGYGWYGWPVWGYRPDSSYYASYYRYLYDMDSLASEENAERRRRTPETSVQP